jgi:hypothetical protein
MHVAAIACLNLIVCLHACLADLLFGWLVGLFDLLAQTYIPAFVGTPAHGHVHTHAPAHTHAHARHAVA